MVTPPKPQNEAARLQELYSLGIVDTADESSFNDLVKLASEITGCPVSLISLVTEDRQWFKAKVGTRVNETARDISFCGHAILNDELFEVQNALTDLRFSDNPLVADNPHIRFYAGQPLITSSGYRIGTLCVIDTVPKSLSDQQKAHLSILAKQVMRLIDLKIAHRREKNSAEELDLSFSNFRYLFERTSVIFAMMSGPEHRFQYVNPAHVKLLGGVNATGFRVIDVQPEAKNTIVPLLDQVFQTGQSLSIPEAKFHVGTELHSFDFIFTPSFDESGNVSGVMSLVNDVSANVRAREEIKNSAQKLVETQEQLDLALKGAGMGTWHIDLNTKHVTTSNGFSKIFGVENVEGNIFAEIARYMHPDDRDEVNRIWTTAVAERKPYFHEYRIVWPNQTVRWVQSRGSVALGEKGEARTLSGVLSDVTSQKMAQTELSEARQEAERANSAKSAFLANMSHEIRSPLGAIMGFAELLKTANLTREELINFVGVIDRNSQHLLRIIDDILDLSKVEAGKMLIEQIPFSLPDLLVDFSSLMGFKAKDKGIEFELRIPNAIPSVITSDPTRIRQILTNVVGNAIKFTERGRVQLLVNFSDNILSFTVNDTGQGMSAVQVEKLFQPFQQADVSTTRKFGGTGLGLVLTRMLTETMGGGFQLNFSELGRGSIFVASVRVKVPEESTFVERQSIEFLVPVGVGTTTEDNLLRGAKVLVVEDSPDNQELFELFLSKAGALVDIADDGYEGVNQALAKNYDLIFMDVQMPRMDGHEATEALRKKGYLGPIIALTAHAMKEEREKALRSGFTDFLSKPVQKDALIEMVKKYFHKP